MKIEEKLKLSKLFDAYSKLLTKGQQDILYDYLVLDITASEIAENKSVSRQAVKDAIDKGSQKLETLEAKLHFVKKLQALESELNQLKGRK